jgi:putative transposase
MSTVAELFFTEKDLSSRWKNVKDTFWSDLRTEALRAVKNLLEHFVDIEIQDLIGAGRWKHVKSRRTYRNGFDYRTLHTSLGFIPDLKIARVRDGNLQPHIIDLYARRSPELDACILEMFLAGVCTRRVQEVLTPLAGEKSVSASTVSEISKVLDGHVQRHHQRSLTDDYVYILLDGVYFKAKSPIKSKRRCILVAYGFKTNGSRELIDFRLANNGESRASWEAFLNSLFQRGLTGKNLRIAVVDGNKGLHAALELVWPHVLRQDCWAHAGRNAVKHLPRKLQDPFAADMRKIYTASSQANAVRTFKHLDRLWRPVCPQAVDSLQDHLENLLVFFQAPKDMWVKIRTTNAIERVFREVRRRTRPMSTFQNTRSLERIVFAIFERQNRLYREQAQREARKLKKEA